MLKELSLEAGTRLRPGTGHRLCGLRLADNDLPDWQRVCRVESLASAGSELGLSTFDGDGASRLLFPENGEGTWTVTIELAEPYGGGRLIGAFELTVDGDGGITYRTVGEGGETGVGGEIISMTSAFRIPMVAERPGRAVPLKALVDRERCLPLPDRRDGAARVLTLHADESTVVGRCYASQLRGHAQEFLERLGEEHIHWVTLWDDRWVNKLSARFAYHLAGGKHSLTVRNITNYSQASNELRLVTSAHGERVLPPGESIELPLQPQDTLSLQVGEGENRRQLVACRFVELLLGKVRVPVFQTEKTHFRFPPEDRQALEMRYLGIWLPLDLARFERLLALAEEPLRVGFPDSGVYFWVRYRHGRGVLTVSSNEDLKQGLAR
jgi:hypothetical protein